LQRILESVDPFFNNLSQIRRDRDSFHICEVKASKGLVPLRETGLVFLAKDRGAIENSRDFRDGWYSALLPTA